MKTYLRLSYASSLTALGVSACCVLPITLILLGLGGSWVAIFGKIAAFSYWVLALSTIVVGLSGYIAYKRGATAKLKLWLLGAVSMTVFAWIVVLSEAQINDFLISRM